MIRSTIFNNTIVDPFSTEEVLLRIRVEREEMLTNKGISLAFLHMNMSFNFQQTISNLLVVRSTILDNTIVNPFSTEDVLMRVRVVGEEALTSFQSISSAGVSSHWG